MRTASSEYKQAMDKPIRNRGYMSIGIGIVNQSAQKDGEVTGNVAEWCNKDSIFDSWKSTSLEYATLEQNFMKSDGSMIFMPEKNMQKKIQAAVSKNTMSGISITFSKEYTIKGMTIDFGNYYPTEFMILFSDKIYEYVNDKPLFSTNDIFEDVKYFDIYPKKMIGGEQRLRIYEITMGVGLKFSNTEIKSTSINESVSPISLEIPNQSLGIELFDQHNRFNVDDNNSYIQFLESMQEVTVSFGIDLDSGEKEWIDYAKLYLTEWDSYKGILSIKAEDRISVMEDEYSQGNKLYRRTAYQEATNILKSAGLTENEYIIDDYLKEIELINPMPILNQKECLQILANACRCKLYQDYKGRIVIKANFAKILSPDEMTVTTNGTTEWSNERNILHGSSVVYADMTKDFLKANGSMYFLPENKNYLKTSYVSEQISDSNGMFETNPTINIGLPAAYSYSGISIRFDGNVPRSLIVRTYNNDVLNETVYFDDLNADSYLKHDFASFDRITIEFTQTNPYSRVLVDKISLGELTDYVLTKNSMVEQPHGYVEKKTKSVRVKVFSFQNNENGELEEMEDSYYYEKQISKNGVIKICENPLVSTIEHAELLAEWIGNYYSNNIAYDVNYRGEPRIEGADIFNMESDYMSDLEVEVEQHTLNFNGTLSGSLALRRSMRMVV